MHFQFVNIDSVRASQADVAVVIDVLRAFTVAPWVLHQGARRLWLAASNADALALKSTLGNQTLAMKDGEPKAGFELSNSPDQVSRMNLFGHQVVQRTTNGTVGVLAASHLPVVLAASLVNAAATVAALMKLNPAVVDLVITGENGQAEEDLAAAEYIAAQALAASGNPEIRLDTSEYEERVLNSAAADRLRNKIRDGHPGVGATDIEMAMATNTFNKALSARKLDLGTCLEFR